MFDSRWFPLRQKSKSSGNFLFWLTWITDVDYNDKTVETSAGGTSYSSLWDA